MNGGAKREWVALAASATLEIDMIMSRSKKTKLCTTTPIRTLILHGLKVSSDLYDHLHNIAMSDPALGAQCDELAASFQQKLIMLASLADQFADAFNIVLDTRSTTLCDPSHDQFVRLLDKMLVEAKKTADNFTLCVGPAAATRPVVARCKRATIKISEDVWSELESSPDSCSFSPSPPPPPPPPPPCVRDDCTIFDVDGSLFDVESYTSVWFAETF